MQKNLLVKTIFIIAVLLIFAYGIFGIPKSFTPQGLKEAMLQRGRLACAHVRPPLSPLPKDDQPVVRAALEHLQPWITPPAPRLTN